jgi:hypothetical protein
MSSDHPALVDDDPAAVRTRSRRFKWSDSPNTARNLDQFAEWLTNKPARG